VVGWHPLRNDQPRGARVRHSLKTSARISDVGVRRSLLDSLPLTHAALEVDQVAAHLIQCKAECKELFELVR